MTMEIKLGEVGHIIQLSIAPVFLLTGVGTNLLVLTNRLARIIDRSRVLEDRLHASAEPEAMVRELAELDRLYRRSHVVNVAIALSTMCALLICVVVAALFVGDALDLRLGKLIAVLFVLAMASLTGSFVLLLRETLMATALIRQRHKHHERRLKQP